MKTLAFALLFHAAFAGFGILLPSTQTADGQPDVPSKYTSNPFRPGEVLRYSVKWSFVRLGAIELRQPAGSRNGDTRSTVSFSVVSASGLPFVDVRLREQSCLNAADPRSTDFLIRREHEPKEVKRYTYDTLTQFFAMELRPEGKRVSHARRQERRRCYDAVGMLMMLRGLAGSGDKVAIPTLMDFAIRESRASFPREIERIQVAAFNDQELPAYRVSVSSSWTDESAGGMGGNFVLWCTVDEAAIPLRAEIEIALGSIVIELESCTRPGWSHTALSAEPSRPSGGKEVAQ